MPRFRLFTACDLSSLLGQLTDQPIRFKGISEPGLRPTMRHTGFHERWMHVLAIFVKKREFTSRLRQATGEITALSWIWTRAPGSGNFRFGVVYRTLNLLHTNTSFFAFLPKGLV
jgi:hypothetical protein